MNCISLITLIINNKHILVEYKVVEYATTDILVI